jgi:hypothetical protein
VESVVLSLPGEGFKPLWILLPTVSFHAGELTKVSKVWPENPTSRRLPVIARAASFVWRSSSTRRPVQLSLFHMPFAPEVQQLIQQVEQLSNRPVHE